MHGLKTTAEEHKRKFEADDEASYSTPPAKKPHIPHFKLPQNLVGTQHQRPKRKGPDAFDDERITEQPQPRKQLPSPPAELGLAVTFPKGHNLSKDQRRLRQSPKRARDQLAMQKVKQQKPLPSPPTSATGSTEATTLPEPPSIRLTTAIIPASMGQDESRTSYQPNAPMNTTPLSILANGAPIESLSTELLQIVLGHVLPPRTQRTIQPFYMKGIMRHGMRSEPYDDQGVIDNENIDLLVFQVSRAFHQVSAKLFYGRNKFWFKDPDACS